jgi:hypothetical protein
VAYLLIIIIVALAGITRITLQQRREHKLHVQNDFRSSLEKVATQPLARADDGPRRRWELAGWSERKKAREERVVAEKPKRREEPTSNRSHPARGERQAPRRSETRSAPRRAEQRPAARPERSRRAETRRNRPTERMRHRQRAQRRYEEEVDWFDDLRAQPSDIHLDFDPSPARLPVSSRRMGQPSTRGRLQPEFHARIHPAHLPPAEDREFDLGPARAYSRQRAV